MKFLGFKKNLTYLKDIGNQMYQIINIFCQALVSSDFVSVYLNLSLPPFLSKQILLNSFSTVYELEMSQWAEQAWFLPSNNHTNL